MVTTQRKECVLSTLCAYRDRPRLMLWNRMRLDVEAFFQNQLKWTLYINRLQLRVHIWVSRRNHVPAISRLILEFGSCQTHYWHLLMQLKKKNILRGTERFNQKTRIHCRDLNSVGIGHRYCQNEISLPFSAVFQSALARQVRDWKGICLLQY